MLNCSICHIIIHKFFFNQNFRSGWDGGGLIKIFGYPSIRGPHPQNLFRKAKLFPENDGGRGDFCFRKQNVPKYFPKH